MNRPHVRKILAGFNAAGAGLCLTVCFYAQISDSQTNDKALAASARIEQFQAVAPGIEHSRIVSGRESAEPLVINLLRVDLERAELRLAHALDAAVGLETVSSLAARHGALAAVNAGFFRTSGTYRGDAVGALIAGGTFLSEPQANRAAVGSIEQNGQTKVVFGHLNFKAALVANGRARHAINGLNRPRGANELLVFTPEFHRTTLTMPNGMEVIVRRGRVTARRDGVGSSLIPHDGFVVSVAGAARSWALRHLPIGARVRVEQRLVPIDAATQNLWDQATQVVGGGPQLVKDGRVAITAELENVGAAFVQDRHPRTAIAQLGDGRILLVTVDGRQPGVSLGLSLPALAELLIRQGAREAINLDGGGSTTMFVKGQLVNQPSDQSGERPVSDAILIFPKAAPPRTPRTRR
ncbi:MAG: phosphodiester glycosidase family protein [Acidobacteriota bacterium]|nr:phosphodiester glycosidase family protein [Acidobacteriota bacterium]